MSNQKPSPNDQRSNVKNPNNPAYEADRENRTRQGHEAPATPPEATPQPAPAQQPPKK